MQHNEDVRSSPVSVRIGLERGHIDHGELRAMPKPPGRLALRDEHILREQAVPGEFGHHANGYAIEHIGTGVAIHRKEFSAGQVRHEITVELVEGGFTHRSIHRAPIDQATRRWFVNDELVVGHSSRVRAGSGDQGPFRGKSGLSALKSNLIELRHVEVPQDPCGGRQPDCVEAARFTDIHWHSSSSL